MPRGGKRAYETQPNPTRSQVRAINESEKVMTKPAIQYNGISVPQGMPSLPLSPRQQRVKEWFDPYNFSKLGSPIIDNIWPGRGYPWSGDGHNFSSMMVRPPVPVEREQVQVLARRLMQVEVEGTTTQRVGRDTPPGRLNVRRLQQQRVALRAGNPNSTYRPFTQIRTLRRPTTPTRASVVLDLSGSMDQFAALGASVAYAFMEAMTTINGKASMVGFSNKVTPLVSPEERVGGVMHLAMNAGNHCFASAVYAADASLDLVDSDGARLMLVFSDGDFGHTEPTILNEVCHSGVDVVWLCPGAPASIIARRPAVNFTMVQDVAEMEFPEIMRTVGNVMVESTRRHHDEVVR